MPVSQRLKCGTFSLFNRTLVLVYINCCTHAFHSEPENFTWDYVWISSVAALYSHVIPHILTISNTKYNDKADTLFEHLDCSTTNINGSRVKYVSWPLSRHSLLSDVLRLYPVALYAS